MCRRPNTVSSSNSCRKSLKLNNKYFFIEKNYIELTSYLRIKWKNSRMNKLMNYHSYRILLYRSSFFIPPLLYYFSLLLFLYQFLFTHSFINFTAYPYLSILVHCLFYFYVSLSLLVQILFIVLICFIL